MFNVSFCSNYKLNIDRNFPSEAMDKIYDYELEGAIIESDFTTPEEAQRTNIYEKMSISLSDEHDVDFETYLISKGINFNKITTAETMDIENIRNRIKLSNDQKERECILVEVNTNKLNELLKKDGISYIERNGVNGIGNRYQEFEKYLKTGKTITPTEINIDFQNNNLSTYIIDGRHRFAYLRDMGMKKIPIAMSKESYEQAKEYGLFN